MFTGIIEEKGKVISVSRSKVQKIVIESGLEVHKGDSIAIQGICLTVTDLTKNGFTVDVMRQTRGVTTLNDWRAGDHVNLERALRIGDRLGGHIMLGHVDEVGKLVQVRTNAYSFKISPKNAAYLIPKGSIGINGASLTIATAANNIFSVSLIPYTLNSTTLGELRTGAWVNIEYDYLAKLLCPSPS
jgi:riboflavin synthase